MSFVVGFGSGGAAGQWYLPGTDPAALPAPAGAAPLVAGVIQETRKDGALTEGPAFDGRVAVVGGAAPDGRPDVAFDVVGAWNSVKNAAFVSDGAARLQFSGFVHVDVTTGGDGDASVLIDGAKRGNVATGGGDDAVSIRALTNGDDWVNAFRVAAGAGDDTVTVGPLDRPAAAAAGDATFAASDGGAGVFATGDAATGTFVDLGDGDDRFVGLGESRDDVRGGAGGDAIAAGRGDDTLAGGPGGDLFVFGAGDGDDVVSDFATGASGGGRDALLFPGLDLPAIEAMLEAALQDGADTVLSYGEGDTLRLVGVAPAELSAGGLVL